MGWIRHGKYYDIVQHGGQGCYKLYSLVENPLLASKEHRDRQRSITENRPKGKIKLYDIQGVVLLPDDGIDSLLPSNWEEKQLKGGRKSWFRPWCQIKVRFRKDNGPDETAFFTTSQLRDKVPGGRRTISAPNIFYQGKLKVAENTQMEYLDCLILQAYVQCQERFNQPWGADAARRGRSPTGVRYQSPAGQEAGPTQPAPVTAGLARPAARYTAPLPDSTPQKGNLAPSSSIGQGGFAAYASPDPQSSFGAHNGPGLQNVYTFQAQNSVAPQNQQFGAQNVSPVADHGQNPFALKTANIYQDQILPTAQGQNPFAPQNANGHQAQVLPAAQDQIPFAPQTANGYQNPNAFGNGAFPGAFMQPAVVGTMA